MSRPLVSVSKGIAVSSSLNRSWYISATVTPAVAINHRFQTVTDLTEIYFSVSSRQTNWKWNDSLLAPRTERPISGGSSGGFAQPNHEPEGQTNESHRSKRAQVRRGKTEFDTDWKARRVKVFDEVKLIWRDSAPSLCVLISVALLFLSRLGLKLGVQVFSRLCGCL